MRPPFPIPVLASAVTLLTAAAAPAQIRVQPRPPMQVQGALLDDDPAAAAEDQAFGTPVQMLESPNIDRFLLRAQDFLGDDRFASAIKILQDVVEGRTLEETTPDAPNPAPQPQTTTDEPANASDADAWVELSESPLNAVFSNDGKLFRPVRRLCHELLAALPPVGQAQYRALFEVDAERALVDARARRDVHAYEALFNRYFLTIAAGRAMDECADLLMDAGSFRAAIQTWRLLLDVYPAEGRREAGIATEHVRVKVALCFHLLGDHGKANDELQALATDVPDRSLRIMGELFATADLATEEWLGDRTTVPANPDRSGGGAARGESVAALRTGQEELVPLWEHRFADERPYRSPRAKNSRVTSSRSSGMTPAPKRNAFVPGTSVTVVETPTGPDRLAFLDHFRLRVADTLSGRLVAEDPDGTLNVPNPRQGYPTSRVPAYDFSSARVVHDGDRMFAILGPNNTRPPGMAAVTRNRLVSFGREDAAPRWTSEHWREYDKVTFLSTPTVFGHRLLVPVSRRGTIALQCLDALTGAPLFRVYLHRGGTTMARSPAVPVVVARGIAYVLTNAGCLASVDAYTGSLRWIRRYERLHPMRPGNVPKPTRGRGNLFASSFFREIDVDGFAPTDLVVTHGLVVLAPTDGRALLCIDGASGELVWALNQIDAQYVVGHDDERLYVAGRNCVYSIGLRSGIRYWREDLPAYSGSSWRGRGAVERGLLVMPGNRELLVRPTADGGHWQRQQLATFSDGAEPLSGPFNVHLSGPYIVLTYAAGIETYSSLRALGTLADGATDPLRRASFQAQAGDMTSAIASLEAVDIGQETPERARRIAARMLALASEYAVVMATHGARTEALDLLERCRSKLQETEQTMRWHLARIEIFRVLGDVPAMEREQEALYRVMERGDR